MRLRRIPAEVGSIAFPASSTPPRRFPRARTRIPLARLLGVFGQREAPGLGDDAAVDEAEERLMITRAPDASADDDRPVCRHGPDREGPG